jgi:hypothetical protein
MVRESTSPAVPPTAVVDPAQSNCRLPPGKPDPVGFWPLWQVIPLALVLAAPFVVGALYGYSAVRRHDRTGWVGLVVHLAMAIVAIVMPITESIHK